MHTFLHGCNTPIEAKNKQTFRGSQSAQCTRSSPTLVCLLHLTPLRTHSASSHLCTWKMPFPFLLCFKPEGRQHLLLEAFLDLPSSCLGVHILTVLLLGLALPECKVKSFPPAPQDLGALQRGPCEGQAAPFFLFPQGWDPRRAGFGGKGGGRTGLWVCRPAPPQTLDSPT